MSERFANRQREQMWQHRGHPLLWLEFDVHAPDKVSMWAHTQHDVPFADMQRAFEAIRDHIQDFIADGYMCPFNPAFRQEYEPKETAR